MHEVSRYGPHGLLHHLPEFGILVCRTCQFAVQPSALPSHLLRHQIYRNERRQLLQRLSKLTILDPDQIPVPSANTSPLPDLPVHKGYRCQATDCSHACASQKRMSQHWSEVHGERDSRNVRARSAYLQTFFRGNKIRYFEVNGYRAEATPSQSTTDSPNGNHVAFSPREDTSEIGLDAPLETPVPALDMEALRYLHHFTVFTSQTIHRGKPQTQSLFWAQTIPQEALNHPFLMYGILGLAAFHLACETTDFVATQAHRDASLRYQSAGLADFRVAMRTPDMSNSTALIAYARIIGIQRCTRFRFHETIVTDLSQIMEFLPFIRGTIETLLSLQHLLPYGSDFILSDVEMDGLRDPADERSMDKDMQASLNVPPSILARLESLPTRVGGLLPPPDCIADVQASASAASALIAGFARSYASNDILSLWNGVETWLRNLPDHFLLMLEQGKPSALIIFAHWCLLLRRVEDHYWFVKGQPQRFINIVLANLDDQYKPFVADIMDVSLYG